MLVFSSHDSTKSFGPNGSPFQTPAYKSRIGPAFLRNCGSRGKIQCSYCHGLIASSSSVRHTVLLLIGSSSRRLTRRVRSASDCRLIGSPVSATVWQAVATTTARSIGGKSGLATSACAIVHSEIACCPALPPASHLTFGKPDAMPRDGVGDGGVFVDEQGESIALGLLNENRSSPRGDMSHLQKIVREGTENGSRSRHRSPPGKSGERSCHANQPKIQINPDVICETDH